MKVLIVGSNGLVGSACKTVFSTSKKVTELITSSRKDTDLFSFEQTKRLISSNDPDVLIIAAAKVGGIYANNTQRVDFLLENLKINSNLLEACIEYPNIKIINLGSSCIYPLDANNPISETEFMNGKLEPTNSPYALAKITAIELGRSLNIQYGHKIINLMPTNLYGPNDNFSEINSHVIPGLIRRMHNAKINNDEQFKIWGTGKPLREFLYSTDLAHFIEFIIEKDIEDDLINVGSGEEVSIYDLAKLIKNVTGYKGTLIFDKSKPDGNPRKLLDISKLQNLGWKHSTSLEVGLKNTYEWFLKNTA
jgi:GDP-L-fucose synthase